MSWDFFRFKYRHNGPQPENFSTQTYTQLPASQEDICNRIEWSKALRQGKYPSILLSLYLEMNNHYYDRMDASSFSSTFGVKVIKEIFFHLINSTCTATESYIWHRWIVLDLSRWKQGLSLHKHLLLWYLKSVTVTSTVSYIWWYAGTSTRY